MIQLKTLNKAPFGYTASSAIPAGLDHLCSHSGSFVMEIWKDIPGYEGYFQSSDFGRIRSIDRIYYSKIRDYYRLFKGKIKPPYCNMKRFGYYYISLHGKSFSLHRLIWVTFNGNIPIGLEINHIDGDKSNNNILNLELVTSSENKIHAYKYGLKKPLISKNNPLSKPIYCTSVDGKFIKRFDSICDAERDGYRKSSIIGCLKERLDKHNNLKWYYEKS